MIINVIQVSVAYGSRILPEQRPEVGVIEGKRILVPLTLKV
jgi:hypothetical protein